MIDDEMHIADLEYRSNGSVCNNWEEEEIDVNPSDITYLESELFKLKRELKPWTIRRGTKVSCSMFIMLL